MNQYVWQPYYIDALAVRYYDADTDNIFTEGNDGPQYYCQDANFNVTAVVNASGTVLERYQYSPYGKVTFLDANFGIDADGISDIGNTHLYTGRELDPETGIQWNRHRPYGSHLGRWITRDPIEYEGSEWNLYEYVSSRPLASLDALGLYDWKPPGRVYVDPSCGSGIPIQPEDPGDPIYCPPGVVCDKVDGIWPVIVPGGSTVVTYPYGGLPVPGPTSVPCDGPYKISGGCQANVSCRGGKLIVDSYQCDDAYTGAASVVRGGGKCRPDLPWKPPVFPPPWPWTPPLCPNK